MSDTKKLIDELKEYSKDLSKIDEHLSGSFMDHGIMTTVRMETIDVIGRACVRLDELTRALARYEHAELPEYPPVIIDSLKAAGKALNWPLIEQASYDALRDHTAQVTVERDEATERAEKAEQDAADYLWQREEARASLKRSADAHERTQELLKYAELAIASERERAESAEAIIFDSGIIAARSETVKS